ncbi:MAG: hypothetical protein KAH03_07950 [Cocleimonas sp.]|nr:hypothetical protein [Cocleimonas sp.]
MTQASKKDAAIEQTVLEEFRAGMADFNAAMQYRDDLSIRIGRRTTQIIRFTLAALVMMASVIFFLIWILMDNMGTMTRHISEMAGDMRSMRQNFQQVSGDMHAMRTDFALVSTDLKSMTQTMRGMQSNITTISTLLARMDNSTYKMNENITGINGNVQFLSKHVGNMSLGINRISHDVNKMAAPMRMFPY